MGWKTGAAGMLLALAAPALAEPMASQEFEQRFQALQNPTVQQCLDPAKRSALSGDALLDACIAAVTDVEAAIKRDKPVEAAEGVYLVLDLYLQRIVVHEFMAMDGSNYDRTCRTAEVMRKVRGLINPYYYAEPVRSQVQSITGEVDRLVQSCGGG